jgi:excisionase family DNA binding protein
VYLTPKQVAERLGVSRETVRRRMIAGELAYVDLGGGDRETRRIPEESLAEFIKARTRRRKRAPKVDAGPDLLVEAGGRW